MLTPLSPAGEGEPQEHRAMLDEVDEGWLNRRYYGGDLPPDAERFLHLAALSHADGEAALAWLGKRADRHRKALPALWSAFRETPPFWRA